MCLLIWVDIKIPWSCLVLGRILHLGILIIWRCNRSLWLFKTWIHEHLCNCLVKMQKYGSKMCKLSRDYCNWTGHPRSSVSVNTKIHILDENCGMVIWCFLWILSNSFSSEYECQFASLNDNLHKKYPRPRVFSYSSLIKLHKKSTCFWKKSLSFLETKNTSKYSESTHYASAQTYFFVLNYFLLNF